MKTHLLIGCSALAIVCLFAARGTEATAQGAPSTCKPTIEGPIPITATSKPYERVKMPAAGAVEEEFFVSCDVAAGHYKTLINVRLPKDPVKQTGIVVIEPWHPGNLWSVAEKVSEYEAKAGHVAMVVVSDPMVVDKFIKKADPTRYASLSLPAGPSMKVGTSVYNATEFEVLGQVGAFIKSGGIPGVNARKVILGGMSQTGGVVRAYIAHEHPKPGMKSIYDGYFPEQSAATSYTTTIPDLDVPVVELQGERELIVVTERGADHITYRRPDGPLYRLYEVPGMPHANSRGRAAGGRAAGGDAEAGEAGGGGSRCPGGHIPTDFPTFFVYSSTLDNMIAWVDKGTPAQHLPLIETSADGREIKRDAFGNALGGYRTSYVDVPTATYHSTWGSYTTGPNGPSDPVAARCDKGGWMAPLSADQLKKLYPTHDDYVTKVNKSLTSLVSQRLLLPDDAKELRDEAQNAHVP